MLFINLHFNIYKGDLNGKNLLCSSMVLAIAMGMSACQDRNSRNDGMHEASDPATSHDMNKNS